MKEAVEKVTNAINSTLVNYSTIRDAFRSMHSYLLNQLICGLLWTVEDGRMGDGRIDARVQKLAKEMWG